jgi:ribosome-binding protein aMBF1 (putative translation factor)
MGHTAYKSISQQLREAIEASGMSRYRICKEINLTESTMSHFMAGDCGLQLSTIDRLGKLLGLTIVATTKPQPEKPSKGR